MGDRLRLSLGVTANVVVFAIAGCSSNSPGSTDPSGSESPPGPEIAATEPPDSGLPPGPEVAISDPPDGDDSVAPEGFTLVTMTLPERHAGECNVERVEGIELL